MGDGSTGLLNGGHGPAVRCQMAQVEGHGLWAGGQCPVAAGVGPFLEAPPGGDVAPAYVVGVGVPESGGDGRGRLAVGTGQFQGVLELRDSG